MAAKRPSPKPAAKSTGKRPAPTRQPRAQMAPHSKTLSNGKPRPRSRKDFK